jgi:FkbM family methyltransferase
MEEYANCGEQPMNTWDHVVGSVDRRFRRRVLGQAEGWNYSWSLAHIVDSVDRRFRRRVLGQAEGWNYSWSLAHIVDRPGKNDLICEVGSRDALDAIYLQRRFGSNVVAFEPSPSNLIKCKENLAKLSGSRRRGIQLDDRCLNEQTGDIDFWEVDPALYDNPGASSLFKIDFENRSPSDPDFSIGPIQKRITVSSIRFDDTPYAAPHSIFMDVQGAELRVLKGFGRHIDCVTNLVLEACLRSSYQGGCSFWELEKYLKVHGLRYVYSSKYGRNLPPVTIPEVYDGDFNVVFCRH